MNHFRTVCALVWVMVSCLSASCHAVVTQDMTPVHPTPDHVATAARHGWRRRDTLPSPSAPLQLVVALALRNSEALASTLRSVSDPDAPAYGRHLPLHALAKQHAPLPSAVASVLSWVQHASMGAVASVTASGDMIVVDTTVEGGERLLPGAKFTWFDHRHPAVPACLRSTTSYTVPTHISHIVDVIGGVHDFVVPPSGLTPPPEPHAAVTDYTVPPSSFTFGANDTVVVLVVGRCLDGSAFAPNSTIPCQSPPVASFTVMLQQSSTNATTNITVPLGDAGLTYAPDNGMTAVVRVPAHGMTSASVTTTINFQGTSRTLTCEPPASLTHPQRSWVTPHTIWPRYNVSTQWSPLLGTPNTTNAQSVVSFFDDSFVPSDLSTFQQHFHLAPQPIAQIIGSNPDGFAGMESSLDTQYLTGVGRGVDTWMWDTVITSSNQTRGGPNFLAWLVGVNNRSNSDLPRVFSTSWGCIAPTSSYRTRVDQEFMKLGARGVSVLIASGDAGSGECERLEPILYPGSSPYITSVGGTTFEPASGGGNGEEVFCSVSAGSYYTASGGFDGNYARPSYQNTAVQPYLKTSNLPPRQFWSPNGRAFPDVSASANNVLIFDNGVLYPIGGTSSATPTYKVWEDDRSAFHDIVKGNADCGYVGRCCQWGFSAEPGYDAVTGLGSPNMGALLQAALQS